MAALCRDGQVVVGGDRGRTPGTATGSRRHLTHRPELSSDAEGPGGSGRGGCCRRTRVSARLESLADPRVAEQARRSRASDLASVVGVGGGRVDLWRRGGAGVRAEADGRSSGRTGRARPLVQPLRFAARMAGYDPASGSRRVVVLPSLLYGTPARRRIAEARGAAFLECCA